MNRNAPTESKISEGPTRLCGVHCLHPRFVASADVFHYFRMPIRHISRFAEIIFKVIQLVWLLAKLDPLPFADSCRNLIASFPKHFLSAGTDDPDKERATNPSRPV